MDQVETRLEELVHEGPSKAQHNADIVRLKRSTHAKRYKLPAFAHMSCLRLAPTILGLTGGARS